MATVDNSQWVVLGIGGAALVIGVVLAFLGYRGRKKLEVMEATPTVNAADASKMALSAPGAGVELVGVVEADEPLLSPTSQIPCVYYRYKLEHRKQRRERDERTGTMKTSEFWDTVDDRKEEIPFYVSDSSGRCLVYPDGADYIAETRTHEGRGRGRDYLESSGVGGAILESVLSALDDDYEDVLGYRITESLIRVGQPVYVLGTAQRSGEVAAVGKGDSPFIISHKMEAELSRKIRRSSALQYAFAAILALGGIAAMVYSAFM
ncbi:MAG: hypothetical protein H5T74_12885 [Actinobacteria bacterium]|nr:hypothetical protein [Actinomycetota bacterium]